MHTQSALAAHRGESAATPHHGGGSLLVSGGTNHLHRLEATVLLHELQEGHEATTNAHHQTAAQDLCANLASAELIEALRDASKVARDRHVRLADLVQDLGHHSVHFVTGHVLHLVLLSQCAQLFHHLAMLIQKGPQSSQLVRQLGGLWPEMILRRTCLDRVTREELFQKRLSTTSAFSKLRKRIQQVVHLFFKSVQFLGEFGEISSFSTQCFHKFIVTLLNQLSDFLLISFWICHATHRLLKRILGGLQLSGL
mmetsp:Transcript_573/g.1694  ORF Transcript_573/g.1694 Transcript_573/m.1694 type:complete len:254 (-) Transcript_573:4003-4764(-)